MMKSDASTHIVTSFAIRLKELREEKELSQRKLSEDIGVSQANVSRWESGSQDPSTEWIIKLADFFEVTTDYLLGRTDY